MIKRMCITLCNLIALNISAMALAEPIDVLVLYTGEAIDTRAGRDINARIASYISYANKAYENSDVDMSLRLAGIERIDNSYRYVNGENLSGFAQDKNVAALRKKYGADLVTLVNLATRQGNGMICGIGYMPQGRDGKLSYYAANLGFSLVGVDCGLSTFAHELGHNMGLGHSPVQESSGGVFPWARGYGVQGQFATIMAYEHAYGTYNQLQRFSNPRQNDCRGLACGAFENTRDAADASQNLNILNDQISGFVQAVNGTDDGDSGDDGNTGEGNSNPGPATCVKQPVANNLIKNGEFNSLDNWQNGFNTASLSNSSRIVGSCSDSYLKVVDRSAYYSSAYQKLGSPIEKGYQYTLSGIFAVEGSPRATVKIALKHEDGNGNTRFQYLPSLSAVANDFSDYKATFTLEGDSASHTGLYIYGPDAGIDILVDSLSLVANRITPLDPTPVPPVDGDGDLLIDQQFEGNARGWRAYWNTDLYYSQTSSKGKYSLLSKNRRSIYSGPGFTASDSVESGEQYRVTTDVHIASQVQDSDEFSIWAYYIDDGGAHWQKLFAENLKTNEWHSLNFEFSIESNGALRGVRLHFLGPQAGNDLRIDNVTSRVSN